MAEYSPAMIQALLDGPADTAPNGTTSNFDIQPPYDRQAIAVITICVLLVVITGILRAYSRTRVMKDVFLEDYLALAGFACYIGTVWAVLDFMKLGGLFVHEWNIRLSNMLDLTIRMYIFSICYTLSMGFAKAAILLEWNRIFVPHGVHNSFFWATSALLVINTLLYIAGAVAVVCSCVPPRKLWWPFIDGTCLDRHTVDLTAGAFNLVTDIAIFILPQRKIWSLHMTGSRKIGISVVFSFGLLSCASGIGRLYSTVETVYPTPGATGDVSFTVSPMLLWCLAEITCVLLVFFIPMVRGAFSDQSRLGRALTSVRSWTFMVSGRLSSRRTSDSVLEKSWPSTVNSATERQGYQLQGHDRQAVGLAVVGCAHTVTGPSTGVHEHRMMPSDNNILKTTQVEQHCHVVSTTLEDPYHESRHLWSDSEQ